MASYTKDRDSALQQAQQAMNPQRNPQSELPPDIFSLLLQDQLGRDVLGRLGNPRDWNLPPCSIRRPYQWMSMERLPMKRFVKCFFELLTQILVKARKCKVQRVCFLHFQLAGSGGCFFLMKLYH